MWPLISSPLRLGLFKRPNSLITKERLVAGILTLVTDLRDLHSNLKNSYHSFN